MWDRLTHTHTHTKPENEEKDRERERGQNKGGEWGLLLPGAQVWMYNGWFVHPPWRTSGTHPAAVQLLQSSSRKSSRRGWMMMMMTLGCVCVMDGLEVELQSGSSYDTHWYKSSITELTTWMDGWFFHTWTEYWMNGCCLRGWMMFWMNPQSHKTTLTHIEESAQLLPVLSPPPLSLSCSRKIISCVYN